MHRPELGFLRSSAAADIIGIDLSRLPFAGALSDPVAALVFCLTDHVDLTIVNGKVIVQGGQFLDLDISSLVRNHNMIAQKLVNAP